MGYYYAQRGGEPEAVATAIEEQYLPRHAGDRLASTPAGRCLALADRLDSLAGVFALGKRPSGNKDPYGLRRSALGLVRTIIEAGLDVSLPALIERAVAAQPVKVTDRAALAADLYDFIVDRLRAWYLDGQAPGLASGDVSAELFEAVRERRPASPLDFHARLQAVKGFTGMAEAASLAVANKRIANILKSATDAIPERVDPGLFDAAEERWLHEAVEALSARHAASLKARAYGDVLRQLATLRDPVDAFFTAVMVMAEDSGKRRNRLALLQRLRHLFLDVADLSCLNAQ
jgi:glycyl-tRNA synthetase beta chain